MLTIRAEQVEVFRREFDASIADAIVEFLRSNLPGSIAGVAEHGLRLRVGRGMQRARDRGFETDLAVTVFVAMMFRFGPDFDRHPSVARALGDRRDAPDERMLTVVLELPDRVWEELAILSDPRWNDGLDANEEGV